MKRILVLFLLTCYCAITHAQELLPFVTNFTKSQYEGDNQVWSSTQGEDHAMYFANNKYLLRYNGVSWEKYTLPNQTIIRSVYAVGDRIYTGSYNEFGYWTRESNQMKYHSLSAGKALFTGVSINEEIWKIFRFQGKLYFQSFNELYTYEEKGIQKMRIPFLISYCFVVRNELYVAGVTEGIHRLQGKEFVPVNGWEILQNTVVHGIQAVGSATYIFTHKKGVYIDSGQGLQPWSHPLNEKLKKESILSAQLTSANQLVIGTALNGVYLVDLKKQTYKNINRSNALGNNSVLHISMDREQDLWLGLDNGLAHVEVNSPYELFIDYTGVIGSVYTVAAYENGFMLGSNHGAFICQDSNLRLLPGTQGHVWDIFQKDDQFVIGHNDGTFLYANQRVEKQNDISGGWKFVKSSVDPYYYQANYSGIIRYDSPLDLKQFSILSGITRPIKNIAQVHSNELWAVDSYKGVYRIVLDEKRNVQKVENVSELSGLTQDYGVKLFKLDQMVLFYIQDQWYYYDSLAKQLKVHESFQAAFGGITDIVPIDASHFLVLKNHLIYIITQQNGKYHWQLVPEKYYKGKIINQDIKLKRYGDVLLLNLDDGFLKMQLSFPNKNKAELEVAFYVQGQFYPKETTLPYNQSVRIEAIQPYFGNQYHTLYYQLDNEGPRMALSNGSFELANLRSGTHEVTYFVFDGVKYDKVYSHELVVGQPWYWSIWMILFYLGCIAGILYLYYLWNKQRYLQKLRLKEEEIKHQTQIDQLEKERENELRMQQYEREILEMQVQTKASELAEKSFSIVKQAEMIERIQQLVDQETDLHSFKSKIKKVIKVNSLDKNEWTNFEKNLMQSHQEFVQKLSERYPQLTAKDIRLCIYLRMNMASKEIAPLMNISYRGVELHRYRLRKKLELDAQENLSKFMINL